MLAAASAEAHAQKHPERRLIREGNRNYESQNYESGEQNYRKAYAANPESAEALFNLSDALYKEENYDEAVRILTELSKSPQLSDAQKAKVYHNLGNAMFSQNKLKEALEYYKESLRKDPGDRETKYNLAYVQELLKQQDQNGGGDNNDSDGNDRNDDSGDQQNNQNGDQQDQNGQNDQNDQRDGENEQNQSDSGDERQENNGQQQPNKGEISREDAENILNAIQQQENKTQEKVNEQRQVTVGRSGKNW